MITKYAADHPNWLTLACLLHCLLIAIHSKDIVSILHLLVALASYFRCKHSMPRNVVIKRILLKVTIQLHLVRLQLVSLWLCVCSCVRSLCSTLKPDRADTSWHLCFICGIVLLSVILKCVGENSVLVFLVTLATWEQTWDQVVRRRDYGIWLHSKVW